MKIEIHNEKKVRTLLEQIHEYYRNLDERGPLTEVIGPSDDGVIVRVALEHFCRHIRQNRSPTIFSEELALTKSTIQEIDEIIALEQEFMGGEPMSRATTVKLAVTRDRVSWQQLVDRKRSLAGPGADRLTGTIPGTDHG